MRRLCFNQPLSLIQVRAGLNQPMAARIMSMVTSIVQKDQRRPVPSAVAAPRDRRQGSPARHRSRSPVQRDVEMEERERREPGGPPARLLQTAFKDAGKAAAAPPRPAVPAAGDAEMEGAEADRHRAGRSSVFDRLGGVDRGASPDRRGRDDRPRREDRDDREGPRGSVFDRLVRGGRDSDRDRERDRGRDRDRSPPSRYYGEDPVPRFHEYRPLGPPALSQPPPPPRPETLSMLEMVLGPQLAAGINPAVRAGAVPPRCLLVLGPDPSPPHVQVLADVSPQAVLMQLQERVKGMVSRACAPSLRRMQMRETALLIETTCPSTRSLAARAASAPVGRTCHLRTASHGGGVWWSATCTGTRRLTLSRRTSRCVRTSTAAAPLSPLTCPALTLPCLLGEPVPSVRPRAFPAWSQVVAPVRFVTMVRDRVTSEPKGYAFVEFFQQSDAQKALKLDSSKLLDRVVRVRPKEEHAPLREVPGAAAAVAQGTNPFTYSASGSPAAGAGRGRGPATGAAQMNPMAAMIGGGMWGFGGGRGPAAGRQVAGPRPKRSFSGLTPHAAFLGAGGVVAGGAQELLPLPLLPHRPAARSGSGRARGCRAIRRWQATAWSRIGP